MLKVEIVRQKWLNHPSTSAKDVKILEKMGTKKVEQAFGEDLDFGTSGLRAPMGIGTARINPITMSGIAYAYGKYLINHRPELIKKGIVIARDGRINSEEFSQICAKVFDELSIQVYMPKDNGIQPTSYISYAIKKLGLGGGIYITASHGPKNFNGAKLYGPLGSQLLDDETKIINNIYKDIDILEIKKSAKVKAKFINEKLVDSYVREILSLQLRPNDSKVLKVAFTPLHGAGKVFIPRILQNLNINYCEVKSQMNEDSDFSHAKIADPSNPKCFNRALLTGKMKKADLILATDADGDKLGLALRHKRRFKFINANEIAALYLNYVLNEYKRRNKSFEGMYIVKSTTSGDLIDKIANHHNINVYTTQLGFKNIAKFIQDNDSSKCLFAFENTSGFLINPEISNDKDAVQMTLGIVEAANYYKTQNSSLYMELKKLNRTYKNHRFYNYDLSLSNTLVQRVLARLAKVKKLGDINVAKIEDFRNGTNDQGSSNFLKIIFKDQRGWVAIGESNTPNTTCVYMNLVSDSIIDNVILERKIKENILDYVEDVDSMKITAKSIIKYCVFVGILIGILVTLLFSLYDIGGSPTEIFKKVFQQMKNGDKIWLFLLIFFANGFTPFFNALYTVRAMKLLGHKVKFRHTSIAATLSTCISAVTPFATGGAIASYWYMRKKGYARSEVMATYFMSSLLYQASLALRTLVFFPLAIYFFRDVFNQGTVTSMLVLLLTIFGLLFDIFAAFMIGLLTFSKKTHSWLVTKSIYILEWLGLTKDPESLRGKYLFEMEGLRGGMNKLWSHKGYLCEFMGYELLPVVISTMFFTGQVVLTAHGFPPASGLDYLKFITGQNLIRAANNMIPTPGGSGTTEWMTSVIFKDSFPNMKYGSIEFTALNRLWTYIIPIIISATLLVVVYANERVNSKIRSKVKNFGLNNKGAIAIKNRFKIWAAVSLVLFFGISFGMLLVAILI